jgi:hypothetical protein
MTDLHFAQQSNSQKIEARQQQHCSENHHRPVFSHDVRMPEEFLD